MEFYRCYVEVYRNGILVGGRKYLTTVLKEKPPASYFQGITWENLEEIYRHNAMAFPFTYYKFSKGHYIEFWDWHPFCKKELRGIKEWKTPHLNMSVKFSFQKTALSLDEILKWPDADEAIKYLKEHGLALEV